MLLVWLGKLHAHKLIVFIKVFFASKLGAHMLTVLNEADHAMIVIEFNSAMLLVCLSKLGAHMLIVLNKANQAMIVMSFRKLGAHMLTVLNKPDKAMARVCLSKLGANMLSILVLISLVWCCK